MAIPFAPPSRLIERAGEGQRRDNHQFAAGACDDGFGGWGIGAMGWSVEEGARAFSDNTSGSQQHHGKSAPDVRPFVAP